MGAKATELSAMYCSGNHIFEILNFKHREYVLSLA